MYNDTPVRSVYKTNYECLREMNEEELAKELAGNGWDNSPCKFCVYYKPSLDLVDCEKQRTQVGLECEEGITKWLKQEANNETFYESRNNAKLYSASTTMAKA